MNASQAASFVYRLARASEAMEVTVPLPEEESCGYYVDCN